MFSVRINDKKKESLFLLILMVIEQFAGRFCQAFEIRRLHSTNMSYILGHTYFFLFTFGYYSDL